MNAYDLEVKTPTARTKCDLRVGNLLIEFKVSIEAGALNEALGQALIYRTHTNNDVIIALPDDLADRPAWTQASAIIGVRMVWERDLPDLFRTLQADSITCISGVPVAA